MAQSRELRQRIKSVGNIQKITKAMKMVAAVKIRKAQETIVKARPYALKMKEVLQDVASTVPADDHPLLRAKVTKGLVPKTLLVVVTADKGMCGSFNANIVRRANAFLKNFDKDKVELLIVGRKGRSSMGKTNFPIYKDYVNIFRNLGYDAASAIGQDVIDRFVRRDIQEVTIIYNEFKSALQQRVVEERLLPLARPEGGDKKRGSEYMFEPAGKALLEVLLPRSLKIQVYRVLLESQAAELSARLMAMDAATKNAGEMIITLTRTYNRIRQAGITKEILEVVSGAEALN